MKLTPQQLENAISQGKTQWLKEYIAQSLPTLFLPSADYQKWFNDFIGTLESRNLSQPNQQKNPLTDVRNAIKVIDPNHKALDVVKFDRQTWIEINDTDSDRIAPRTTKLIRDPEAIVEKAVELIQTNNWSDIAAGLAVLTGRRCAEVLQTAVFEYKSQYTLTFTGSLKRKDEAVKLVFVIPVLCQANLIIKAIDTLRLQLGDHVKLLSVRKINDTYEGRVAQKCDRNFRDLVPKRDGKENLYTHLFKAVYSTIACHWYCPVTVPRMEYCAAIQGHYKMILKPNGKLRRTIASNRNYDDYRIDDGSGNVNGRLGIKLGLPNVEVIDQFQLKVYQTSTAKIIKIQSCQYPLQSQPKLTPQLEPDNFSHQLEQPMNEKNNSNNEAVVSLSVSLDRLETIANKLNLSHSEAINTLVDWAEAGICLAQDLEIEDSTPEALTVRVQELNQNYTNAQHHSAPLAPKGASDNNNSNSISLDEHQRLLLTVSSLSNSVELLTGLLATNAYSLPKVTDSSNSSITNHRQNTKPSYSTNHSSQSTGEPNENHSVRQTTHRVSSDNRKKDTAEVMTQDINRAIDAIIEFNNAPNRPHKQKFYISINTVAELAERSTSSVSSVLKERSKEIDLHHEQHQLDIHHNRSRKDDDAHSYPSIKEEPEVNYTKLTQIT